MRRHFSDWLKAYIDFTASTEPPSRMRFWAGVSAIAGALERKVWLDEKHFKWYPNFYIVLVAPPGVVSKSTTAGIAMNLLRSVEGVKFGPDIVTWQSLVTGFAAAKTEFPYGEAFWPMSAITLESSEFGNLLNPEDREMVDLLVQLWDGKQGSFRKETKTSGNDEVINPWINLIACTTPAWIAGTFPEYMIGGGFTSRCIFVYADKKEKLIAYPSEAVDPNYIAVQRMLIEDLTQIHAQTGPYVLSEGARQYGRAWYEMHQTTRNPILGDDRFGGYLARKQTHIHKLAMVLAAAQSDVPVITEQHLGTANFMVSELEPDMAMVFNRMGRSTTSLNVERLLGFIERTGRAEWTLVYKQFHRYFPSVKDYEAVIGGLVRSGQIGLEQSGNEVFVTWKIVK